MTTGDTKADLISGAYSKLRISGITVDPTPENNDLAISVLESAMHEYKERGACMGYNFEDEPKTSSKHGVNPAYWDPIKKILALRLAPDFGKGDSSSLNPMLVKQASGAVSVIFSGTATPRQTKYPSRQPVGSGTGIRFPRIRRFYAEESETPNTCETKTMFIGDVSDFVEDFNAYLEDSEFIDTFTIEANTGLTINSSAKNTAETAIDYNITATGNNEDANEALKLKIVVTTTGSRVETRIIDFQLVTAEI